MTNHDHHDDAMMAFKLKPELSTVSFSATDNVPSNFPGRLGVTVTVTEVKTPLDIYLQRHSPLSPDLWLHYSRLSARYTSRHVPGAGIISPYVSRIFLLIQVDQARR